MGNPKQKWTAEEEKALLAGIAKHGPGKWKNILRDSEFAPFLTLRSNIDLKDKWRNLTVSHVSKGPKEKSRAPKPKSVAPPSFDTQNLASPDESADVLTDDPSSNEWDRKNALRYNAMIFEALSTIKLTNGCDIGAIVNFIKQRHDVPQNFRKLLSSRLRGLVSQGKLEKVQNYYRIKTDNILGARTPTPTPKQKDIRPRQPPSSGLTFGEIVEEAAIAAAYKVAEAENRSCLAAEAVEEAERVCKMVEDADAMLQLVKEIYKQCSRGEIVLLA
ncbi:hypothetical protein K2173_024313 [Erythroxylum novogranatense]|uniref:MYB transcription factor n=1 Tax=Erythroxylum novogranatense TaxID=1862640 RepID=A0AAV8SV00_9ROSI|nr:hypothetical protein K2173_024313 [Erythroxylum novogranatense]